MEMADLCEMVRLHGWWLNDRSDGRKLDLRDADLRRADLQGAHLRAADFGGANLRGADLREANLLWAHFQSADLQEANLLKVKLRRADLLDADLRGANLRWADLRDANLQSANLQVADLRWADLKGADLRGADLEWADLREANLQGANLKGAMGLPPILPPEVGAFTGFKKCSGNKIVELLIPADAHRSSATTRECRASKALVVSIDGDATPGVVARSIYHPDFRYEVGLVAECDCWEPDRWAACGGGIHFHLTRKEALDYK